ncbi:MAG: hypothetical protein WCS34_04310 [Bacteroidales bacterium]
MKKTLYVVSVILICFSLLLTGCENDNPAYNRENIKGTWIVYALGDRVLTPDEYYICDFSTDASTLNISAVKDMGDGSLSWGTSSVTYNVYCCSLKIYGEIDSIGPLGATQYDINTEFSFETSEDSLLVIKPETYQFDNTDVEPTFTSVKLKKLYRLYSASDSLSGTWELTSKDGVDDSSFRLIFDSEGGIQYMIQDGETDTWTEDVSKAATYSAYQSFIAISSDSNSELGSDLVSTVKCWDLWISNSGDTDSDGNSITQSMKWTSGDSSYSFVKVTEEE